MARVTIEDCLAKVPNMYELVHVATSRARQIYLGSPKTVDCKNKEIVSALREVAEGHVAVAYESTNKDDINLI